MARQALVWNFEDNNFTWMDASIIEGAELKDVRCMRYGFVPGYQALWSDLFDQATTWADLQAGSDPWGVLTYPEGPPANGTQWSDLYSAGKDQNMYWLNDYGVWTSDQVVDKSGVKKYYVERMSLDFTDALQTTSEGFKHVRQIFPMLQSDSDVGVMNTYEFSIGWGKNLMDPPDYKAPIKVYLNKAEYSGKHKIDLRSTGRYMAWKWDFTYTDEINMTAADVDIEPSHGR